jgi:hypothetical protein
VLASDELDIEIEGLDDHPRNLYPEAGVAVMPTVEPALYQEVPDGLVLPPAVDPTVTLYCST